MPGLSLHIYNILYTFKARILNTLYKVQTINNTVFILNNTQVRFVNIYCKYVRETILIFLYHRRIDICYVLSHVTSIVLSVHKSSHDDNTIIYAESTNTDHVF